MGVPYTFSTSTSSIPLSQLDTNFATPVTIGSTTVALGNTTTTLAGLTGVTSSAITDSAITANQIVYAGTGGLLSGSANHTYDTSGNVLLGTTTAFTSTTYGGQFVSGGVGIYPYATNSVTVPTNTTIYSGNVYQNPTVFSGTNGASSQNLYGNLSAPQVSNSGSGGSLGNTLYGYYAQPLMTSTGSSAAGNIYGIYLQVTRYSATDTSASLNTLMGVYSVVSHQTLLASTAAASNVYAFYANPINFQGTWTNLYAYRNVTNVGSSTAVSNTCLITNYYGFASSVTVGTAATSTGTITNYYGVYLLNPTINTLGTITNRFAIYSADTATSYLAGSLGIGTTTPSGKLDVAGTIKTLGYTVATLPTGTVGMMAYATDALTPVFGSTVVGGGAVVIPVFYNGSNWIVG